MRVTSRRGVSSTFFVILIIALAGMTGVFATLWWETNSTSAQAREESSRTVREVTGFDRGAPKKLDWRYTDADGDLVADTPDVGQQIDPDTLVFSFIAENPERTRDDWKEFVDHLSKTTGKKVTYLLEPNAEELVRAMAQGRLHVVGLNTGAVPMAVNLAGFVPMFTLGTPGGGGYLHSEIIVPADSPIQKPEDLKDKTIAFVDMNSNSGCKAPVVILRTKYNLTADEDYKTVYSFGHERSIAGIANKTYEAAAVASDILERDLASGVIKKEQYRKVLASDEFPAVSIGNVYNLKPELVAKIKQAFTTFEFKGTKLGALYAPVKQDRFQPVSYKTDFTSVRLIDDELGRPYSLR